MPRLTPEQLARFRADYHQCRTTIMPLVEEVEAAWAERDEALRQLDAETRLSAGAITGYTRDLCLAREERDAARAERDRLAAACREAVSLIGQDDVPWAVRKLNEALAAEGGG